MIPATTTQNTIPNRMASTAIWFSLAGLSVDTIFCTEAFRGESATGTAAALDGATMTGRLGVLKDRPGLYAPTMGSQSSPQIRTAHTLAE